MNKKDYAKRSWSCVQWTTQTWLNYSRHIKTRKGTTLSLRWLPVVSYSTKSQRDLTSVREMPLTSWSKFFPPLPTAMQTTLFIETWNLKIYYWKVKVAMLWSRLSTSVPLKFLTLRKKWSKLMVHLTTSRQKCLKGLMTLSATSGVVESSSTFYSQVDHPSMVKMTMKFYSLLRRPKSTLMVRCLKTPVNWEKTCSRKFCKLIQRKELTPVIV